MTKKHTIQRKPKPQPTTGAELDAFLGGNATSKEVEQNPQAKSKDGVKRGRPKGSIPRGHFRQSVPMPTLEKLDRYLESHENPPSRNAWIVQAIIEKLARDMQ